MMAPRRRKRTLMIIDDQPDETDTIVRRMAEVRSRIAQAEARYGRTKGSVGLVAVSKTQPPGRIRSAYSAGQPAFGENYVQEAIGKIVALADLPLEWHFIGRIQSNKTRLIAEHFDWVHSLTSDHHAWRISDQRPSHRPPLQVCIQINIDQDPSKDGLDPQAADALIDLCRQLPGLTLRGLMAITTPSIDPEAQRASFARLRRLRDTLASPSAPLDQLSMGMSADLEAAIAEGATLIRVGSAIFGPRAQQSRT